MARIPAAERRAELVDAAVRVIAAHGMDGATTRKIADEAGAPLATLHYCFASKELLFAAVFEHVAAQYRDVLLRNDCHGDLETAARELLRGMLNWYLDNPALGRAIIELISWAQRQDGGQAEMVYGAAYTTIRTILEADAENAGRSVSPEKLDALIFTVTALSDGFALNWLVFGDRTGAAAQVDLTVSILDAWMEANLEDGDAERPKAQEIPGSLVSWVSVG